MFFFSSFLRDTFTLSFWTSKPGADCSTDEAFVFLCILIVVYKTSERLRWKSFRFGTENFKKMMLLTPWLGVYYDI